MLGDLLLFKGNNFYDKIIRWGTRSEFTHVAIDIGNQRLIEAYPGVGVREREYSFDEPGIFRFRIRNSKQEVFQLHLEWLRQQIGIKYDWKGIFGLAFNRPTWHDIKKWFCSCVAVTFAEMCGYILIKNRVEDLVAPGDIGSSPELIQLPIEQEGLSRRGRPRKT